MAAPRTPESTAHRADLHNMAHNTSQLEPPPVVVPVDTPERAHTEEEVLEPEPEVEEDQEPELVEEQVQEPARVLAPELEPEQAPELVVVPWASRAPWAWVVPWASRGP